MHALLRTYANRTFCPLLQACAVEYIALNQNGALLSILSQSMISIYIQTKMQTHSVQMEPGFMVQCDFLTFFSNCALFSFMELN